MSSCCVLSSYDDTNVHSPVICQPEQRRFVAQESLVVVGVTSVPDRTLKRPSQIIFVTTFPLIRPRVFSNITQVQHLSCFFTDEIKEPVCRGLIAGISTLHTPVVYLPPVPKERVERVHPRVVYAPRWQMCLVEVVFLNNKPHCASLLFLFFPRFKVVPDFALNENSKNPHDPLVI